MAREHEPAARPAETAARHYAVLQELRRSPGGDPLSATAPTATINNPHWFERLHDSVRPSPTRRVLHDQLAAELTSHGRVAAPPSSRPVAILLAGPPGSGKSTSLQDVFTRNDTAVTNGLSREDFAVIDADHIKGRLIEQARRDGSLESWIKPQAVRDLEAAGEHFSSLDLASLVHEESSLIADEARHNAIAQRRNVVFDQVCSSPTKTAQLVDQLSAAGYKVSVVEIHATREFSLESTFGRYVATAEHGGDARRVPTEVVESVFTPEGTSKPRAAIEGLLTAQPSKVTE